MTRGSEAARIGDLLLAAALRRGDHPAVVCGERRIGFTELSAAAERLAVGLRRAGLQQGEHVVVQLENSIEAVLAFFGVQLAGGVVAMLHAQTKPPKLLRVLQHCRAAFLIGRGADLRAAAAHAAEATAALPALRATIEAGAFGDAPPPAGLGTWVRLDALVAESASGGSIGRGVPAPADLVAAASDAPAVLIYTSGSTGAPKAVVLSHRNLLAATTTIAAYLGNDADDVVYCALPLSFGYGLSQVLTMAFVGGTLIVEPSFVYPAELAERLERTGATGFPAVPTLLALLLQNDLTGRLPRLRYVTSAGAALPPAHVRQLRTAVPQAQLWVMYGQTECVRASYLPPEEVDRRPDSVGRGLAGQRHVLLRDDGTPCGPNEVGELVLSGPHVMLGYLHDEAATQQAVRTGADGVRWLHTGDLFRADAEGFLYFVARRDDIIKTRGEKVSPREVENVLHELSGVAEVVVRGAPDPLLGEAVQALIVRAPGTQLGAAEVRRHCAERLEPFMVPKLVEFVDRLPRSANGKVLRRMVGSDGVEATR